MKKDLGNLKIAIVCDWLIGGGAEQVVQELHNMFPDAPIYTSYATSEWRQKLDDRVVTSFLQHWPFSKLRKFVPFLRAWWFSHLNLDGYDLIVSISGAEAKAVKTKEAAIHINYCNAPTHYYWSRYDEYMRHPGFGVFDPLARLGLKILVGPMRKWDYKAAQRPDFMIANSTNIHGQIKEYYGRDSVVIFPPVDTERFTSLPELDRKGYVITGRQTPYKRFDLAVAACSKLNLSLTVVGDGPDNAKLKRLAGPSVIFTGFLSAEELSKKIASAEAFIFPGIDDFGISAVEALAAGTPVIAYKGGGALDYVVEGETGLFFDEQTPESLIACLQRFRSDDFSSENIKQESRKFSKETFVMNMNAEITRLLDNV